MCVYLDCLSIFNFCKEIEDVGSRLDSGDAPEIGRGRTGGRMPETVTWVDCGVRGRSRDGAETWDERRRWTAVKTGEVSEEGWGGMKEDVQSHRFFWYKGET